MSRQMMLGVDLGGTTIKIGLCGEDGSLIQKLEGPTEAAKGADQILSNMMEYSGQLLEQSGATWGQIAGVGVGVAGFVVARKGWLSTSPNLGIGNIPLRELLEKRLSLPVKVDNDANTAALGEAWAGAGRGYDHVVCYTLGTGVGGGIIANGQIYQGNGFAGEFGHMQVVPDLEAVRCRCGQTGCLETVSSASGISRMAKEAVERGELGVLQQLDQITAKDVFDAARTGDEAALRIVRRAAHYLAKSMALVGVVLHPQRFIVGGGVSSAGKVLFEPLQESFDQHVLSELRGTIDIVPAELGNDAGVIGAALLISQHFRTCSQQ